MSPLSSTPVIASPSLIGIDVSRTRLDVAVLRADSGCGSGRSRPQPEQTFTCSTTVAGLGQLIEQLTPLAPALVVLEASGGYERGVVEALWAAKIPVSVVNPRRVRHFANGAGYGAKTDRLDACVLAHFGLVLRPAPQAAPPARLRQLRALVRRREQLVGMVAAERQRARQWARDDAAMHAQCQALIATLSAHIGEVNARIDTLVAEDAELASQCARLQSVPGVGRIVAATVLACLPELGQVTDKEVAALAGLAPYSRDSGQWTGERHITGGRTMLRRVVYLAAVAAQRHNPVIRACYERLRTAGKAAKEALVACARKLLVILNAIQRDGSTWVDRSTTA